MSDSNRVDVTDDAINAVLQHITSMKEYKENDGFAGYEYKKADGGLITIAVIDNSKYRIVKKDNTK